MEKTLRKTLNDRSDMKFKNKHKNYLILKEELAELILVVSKIERFGYSSKWNGESNLQNFIQEIADVMAMLKIVVECDKLDISEEVLQEAIDRKMKKLEKWYSA